jgi:hypothetical protein
MPHKIAFLLLIFVFCHVSCSQSECGSTAVFPVMRIKFYRLTTLGRPLDDTASVAFREIIGVRANQKDTSLYAGTLSQINLPLSPIENESTYIFKYNNLSEDRITFKYNRKNVLISEVCGFAVNFDSLRTDKTQPRFRQQYNFIDSIFVRQPLVSTENEIHVKMYFYLR